MKKSRLFGVLLSLVMVLGLMPGMSLTAYADDQKAYADYDVTTAANKDKSGEDLTALQVKFNEKSWYIIADNSTAVNAGTVTLLAAESLGTSMFHDSSNNKYSTSTIKTTLDNMTASGGSFAGVASAINTVKVKGSDSDDEVDAKLYLLNTTEASNVPVNVRKFSTDWWLRSPGDDVGRAAFVDGESGAVSGHGYYENYTLGVRPALQLDLSKVTFDSASNTFAVAAPAHTHNNITFVPWTDELAAQQNGEGKTAANSLPVEAGSYYLTKNVEVSAKYSDEAAWKIYNKNINLCLNGCSITRTNDGTVIMLDFDPYGDDYIHPTLNLFDEDGDHGTITHAEGVEGCGVVMWSSTFNMYGGSISGNTETYWGSTGGMFLQAGSTFNMYGGKITGNSGTAGGVRVGAEYSDDSDSTFNMYGGEISGNTASYADKDGVYGSGGGVYIGYDGVFNMTGGKISDNTAAEYGGGVFLNQGTFNLSGNPIISGNKLGTGDNAVDSNVYLYYGSKITLTGALTNSTPIGVTTDSADMDFTSGWSTEMSGETPTAYFRSDDPGYTVVKVDNELQLAPQTHTHNFTSYTASGATITAICTAPGCTLPPSTDGGSDHVATLTISANGGTYVGTTAYGATITDDNGIQGEAKVQYQKKTGDSYGTATETAPTDAGDYKASITVGGVTASVEYTIAPAVIDAVTVTGIDAPVAATALDTAATLNTEHVTLRNSNAITWVPAAPQDGLAAYATAYKAAVTADADTNYAFSAAVAATVNGQTADVTKNQDGSVEISLTFSKTALTPVTISAADQEVGYSRDGVSIPVQGMFTVPEGAGAATYSVTEGTGAGSYEKQSGKLSVTKCGTFTVAVATAETETHAAAESSATLTVNKAEATVTPPTAGTLIFNGSPQDLVVSGSTEDGTVLYAVTTEDTQSAPESFFETIPSATDMGTYYVWYKVQGDDNHNDTTAVKLEVTITAPAFGTPDFTLPASIQTIGDNAFEGASMEIVWIPDGCNAIGAGAFKDCENLEQISIPRNCAIGTGAFEGCGTVFIFAPTGSKAESYCSTSTDCVFIADNRK